MRKGIVTLLALLSIPGSCDRSGPKHSEPGPGEISTEIRLLDSWPRDGPELLWIYEGLGKGYGGPLITKEGIFINGEEEGNSYTVCLDHQGKLLWRAPNGQEFVGTDFSASYPGTRSTPAVMGRRIYAASGTGHLSCFDTRNGEVVWTVDLIKEYDGILGDFGYSESPVLDENRVYCFPGGKTNNLVALDRRTGKLEWSAPVKRDYFSYGTPVLITLPGRKVLVGTSRNYIHVVDREDGTLLSSYRLEGISQGNEHCNSVIYKDGFIYFVAFEENSQGTIKLHLSEDGGTLKEIWRNPIVVNVFEGFVVKDNWLYTTLENKKLVGLDTETGQTRFSVRAVCGSMVCADDKLFIYGQNGVVQLYSIKKGIPELSSEMRIRLGTGHHFSFPVIANGVMYIRRGDALMAYAISG